MSERVEADILYVEDNLDHAELVLRCLERHTDRRRVRHLEDGEQAIQLLEDVKKRTAVRPRIVLLDLRLPRVDGLEVLRHMKASPELRNIPVIVFSTSAGARDIHDAYDNHANSYLVKPDDLTVLESVLMNLSAYWLEHNRHIVDQPL